jgi:hypothetical protein
VLCILYSRGSSCLTLWRRLWTILRPGCTIYAPLHGQPRAFRLTRSFPARDYHVCEVTYTDYDGRKFGAHAVFSLRSLSNRDLQVQPTRSYASSRSWGVRRSTRLRRIRLPIIRAKNTFASSLFVAAAASRATRASNISHTQALRLVRLFAAAKLATASMGASWCVLTIKSRLIQLTSQIIGGL